ncbi:MAG: hypothetical protein QM541_04775 [Flavobacterium sp.]|nr:hypothetical protein [Flavobacterium sp.]
MQLSPWFNEAKKSVQICSISVISVPIIVNGHQINHPKLLAENRTRIKILLIDANEDMPIEIINDVLNTAIALV